MHRLEQREEQGLGGGNEMPQRLAEHVWSRQRRGAVLLGERVPAAIDVDDPVMSVERVGDEHGKTGSRLLMMLVLDACAKRVH